MAPKDDTASSPAAPAASLPRFEPDVFGKYFLLQRIAVGGMAEVVRAKTLGAGGFQKELVVKRILPALARDRDFVRMFVNEAKITVGLSHPNIAQIFELGEIDETFFMAMELVDGVQLRELLPLFRGEEARLGVDHAVWTCFEALRGLDHAHRASDAMGAPLGIVHCDISPDNLMITFDATVKVVDFGIARAATGLSNARPGLVMGKVNYLSPEQATGRDVDPRTDVYALGVVLYHLVTGAFPYGRFERLDELAPLVRGQLPYVPLGEHDGRLPDELDAIVRRAVALEPGERYPNAGAFATALEEVLFPTPHSAVAQHLRTEIGRSFAGHRDRLARLRSNDETVMRILARRLEERPPETRPATSQLEALRSAARPPEKAKASRDRARSPWRLTGPQLLVALLTGLLLAGGAHLAERALAPGVLVIASHPAGARALLDGNPVPGVTPVVLPDMDRHGSWTLELTLDGYRPFSRTVAGDGAPTTVVQAELEPAVGALRVESVPAGAQVLLDDEVRGYTPATLDAIDLTVPHKLGLRRRGYELDEVVLQDLAPGQTVRRTLQRRRRRRRR